MATTRYVDIDLGTDSGDGDAEGAGAWATIAYATTNCTAGDTIKVKRGTTQSPTALMNLKETNHVGIIITEYGTGDLPIIDGLGITIDAGIFRCAQAGIEISYLRLLDIGTTSSAANIVYGTSAGTGLHIHHCEFKGNQSLSHSRTNSFGIATNGPGFNIHDNLVEDILGDGISITQSAGIHGTVRANRVDHCNAPGKAYSQDGIRAIGGDFAYAVRIENNEISRCNGDAIDTFSGQNVIVQHNYVHDSPTGGSTQGTGGIKMGGGNSAGNICRGNIVKDLTATSGSIGITTGVNTSGNDGCVIEGNYIENVDYGINVYQNTTNSVVKYNTVRGATIKGLAMFAASSGSTTSTIQDNIFDGATVDLDVDDLGDVTGGRNILVNGTTSLGTGASYTGTDVTGDPFTAATGYEWPVGSIAQGTATWVAGYVDVTGRPLPLHPDCGCWQNPDVPGRKSAVAGIL